MLTTKGGMSDSAIGSRFKPSCNSSKILLSAVMIEDGSDNETKFKTIPSARGRNFSSNELTTLIPDLIGKNTKNPNHPANKMLEINKMKPATYLEPNRVRSSKL